MKLFNRKETKKVVNDIHSNLEELKKLDAARNAKIREISLQIDDMTARLMAQNKELEKMMKATK